jgi:hypothetical protein
MAGWSPTNRERPPYQSRRRYAATYLPRPDEPLRRATAQGLRGSREWSDRYEPALRRSPKLCKDATAQPQEARGTFHGFLLNMSAGPSDFPRYPNLQPQPFTASRAPGSNPPSQRRLLPPRPRFRIEPTGSDPTGATAPRGPGRGGPAVIAARSARAHFSGGAKFWLHSGRPIVSPQRSFPLRLPSIPG